MEARAAVFLSPPPPPPLRLCYPVARCRPQPPLSHLSASTGDLRSYICISARSSSIARAAASTAATPAPPPAEKEKDVVFVAGATGRVGYRAVRELIKLGFRVRAAVRSKERASSLVQSVQQLKLDDESASSPAEKLELVECDLEKQAKGDIVSAIGNAAVVVCSIGASEKEVWDVTGPYRIDYLATNSLVQAATTARVEHFILVTSLGTSKIGFPAFLLNLFWGVLCWKRRAEEALIASRLPYTIVRPGGMERPTDAYKETHNLVAAPQDTYVGGQVSNLQVAELIAFVAKNRNAAYCKVVELIAETTAPLLPMDQLLSGIPSDREPPVAAKEAPAAASSAAAAAGEGKAGTLSPYTAFEDLQQNERPLSPYTRFVDLKPPSSPSPSPPNPSSVASTNLLDSNAIANGPPTTSTSSNSVSGDEGKADSGQLQQKNEWPLSPYTRYEELKPPSSPTPSAPKA